MKGLNTNMITKKGVLRNFVNFTKFWRITILKNICERLLLDVVLLVQQLLFFLKFLKLQCDKFHNKYLQKQPLGVIYEKKVFLKISQNSQEMTCARVSFLIKLQLQLY